MQFSGRFTQVWIVTLILGMTSVSCATHKSAVFSSEKLPPPAVSHS